MKQQLNSLDKIYDFAFTMQFQSVPGGLGGQQELAVLIVIHDDINILFQEENSETVY